MKSAILPLLFFANLVSAQQNNIAQFAVWKPNQLLKQEFEKGYKKHLEWHKTAGDKWNWYGWYFTSGQRAGQFIDATFEHSWKDFDNAVKPAEDRADNDLHVHPFADLSTVFRVAFLPHLSIRDSNSLRSKFLRLIKLDVANVPDAVKVLEKMKASYLSAGIKNFMPFKMLDGGNLNQLIILIGSNNREEFGMTQNFQEELTTIEMTLKIKVIIGITSETLNYLPNMSYFSN